MTIAKFLLCISALCVGMLFLFQFGVLKSKGSFVYATLDIYFTGVGMFERPTTQELQTLANMHEQNAG